MCETAIIIPARIGSTRLVRKLLLADTGKPLICHTIDVARRTSFDVFVATDSPEIAKAVQAYDGHVIMTGECPNGTSRVIAAAKTLPLEYRTIINMQGDEPEVDADLITALANSVKMTGGIATAAAKATPLEYWSPSVVKVVVNLGGMAMYFSRSPIPHCSPPHAWDALRHIGIYAFARDMLARLSHCHVTEIEESEKLEQLRWLSYGYSITVLKRDNVTGRGIDTYADYEEFKLRCQTSNR